MLVVDKTNINLGHDDLDGTTVATRAWYSSSYEYPNRIESPRVEKGTASNSPAEKDENSTTTTTTTNTDNNTIATNSPSTAAYHPPDNAVTKYSVQSKYIQSQPRTTQTTTVKGSSLTWPPLRGLSKDQISPQLQQQASP